MPKQSGNKTFLTFVLTLVVIVFALLAFTIDLKSWVGRLIEPAQKAEAAAFEGPEMVSNEFLLKVKPSAKKLMKAAPMPEDTGIDSLNRLNRQHRAVKFEQVAAEGGRGNEAIFSWYKVTLPGDKKAITKKDNVLDFIRLQQAMNYYKADKSIEAVEPNFLVTAVAIPNDPSFSQLWGLHNSNDADIDAPEAWDKTKGNASVVIAVIDTGVDYNHPDLGANMWKNTAECSGNGADDDGNGYIDDCYGIDTYNNDANPMDDNRHGTHVSGTIGAVGNNNIGVVGVNWNVRIMACKFLGAGGSGSTFDAIECLNYVKAMKDKGVNVIATSNSWGGGGFSQAMSDAIQSQMQHGILFIAAAGNNAKDSDACPFSPASYYLPNVISVAATTSADGLASFSNYGRRTVHLGAPGVSILSTTPNNTYQSLGGTSMATPHVAGLAALLKAENPSRDWIAVKNLIMAGGDAKASMNNTITQKRLNARGSLLCSNSTVLSRLRPVSAIAAGIGEPVNLSALHIRCASPNGDVAVSASPGGQTAALLDNGAYPDQMAGDGIYSGQWVAGEPGTYTLTFSGKDGVNLQVLANYKYSSASFAWRAISGTNLNLSEDSSAMITSPFPIKFGGGSFSSLSAGSNGIISFTGPFTYSVNQPMPTSMTSTLAAPFWDDLSPKAGTSQNVFWAATGSAPNRELVVEWRDVTHYGACGSGTVKFQVVFFEGKNDTLFNYMDAAFGGSCAAADNGGSATAGIQVGPVTGTQFSYNTPSISSGTAILWTAIQAGENQTDTIAPVVSLTSPSNGSSVSGTIIVAASATDNMGVTKVEFYVDGAMKAADTASPYSFSWDTASVPNGAHSLMAQAYDTGNNVGVSSPITVTVNNADITPPAVSIVNPVSGSVISGTVNVSASASDDAGVARVEFYVDGGLKNTDFSSPYGFSWDTTSAANSNHSLMARAYDASGNAGSSTVIVAVSNMDNTPPSTAITGPASGTVYTAPQMVAISASASDNAGVAKVEFYDGLGLKGTDTASPYTYSWNITASDNGVHSWTSRAYDAAGNTGTSSPVTLTVNISLSNRPPTSSFVFSPTSPRPRQKITFNASSSFDPDGSVISYFWSFGDGKTASGKVTTKSYTMAGNYTAMLTVTDNRGANGTSAKIVAVRK